MKQPWQQQQDQLRQQQELMKQQQDQLHQQQMQAYYQQQQANEAATASGQLNDRYAQVEAEVARLGKERDAGRLSEEQFKAKLKELMIQDEQNNWWMISAEKGTWFRHDGSNWLQAVPPGRLSQPAAAPGYYQPTVHKKSQPGRAILFLVFGLLLTFGLGLGFSSLVAAFTPTETMLEVFGVYGIWLVGAILVIRKTVKIWQGK